MNYTNPNRFEDALDERGLLRNGKAVRVAQYMRDRQTVTRRRSVGDDRQYWDSERESLVVTDADATDTKGNQPGWRVSDSPINRQAKPAAYRDYETTLTNSWKNPATGFGSGGPVGHREGDYSTEPYVSRDYSGSTVDEIARDHRGHMAQIYEDRDRGLEEMWRQS
jgi:hypothetical protein